MEPRASLLAAASVLLVALSGCAGTPSGSSPSGPAAMQGTGGSSCSESPEMMLGPYFIDGKSYRSDVRPDYPTAAEAENQEREEHGEDGEEHEESADEEFIDGIAQKADLRQGSTAPQQGVEMRLTITVNTKASDGSCKPLPGARVDVWHANAAGKYSGYAQEGTAGESWLRGALPTDASGQVTFTTIWPGWYPGRAVHIHVKVREGNLDFTSQFFFDPGTNAKVMQENEPYKSRGMPNTPNASDGIYREGGNNMILVTQQAGGHWAGSKAIVVH